MTGSITGIKREVMIDIETLGTKHDAVVVSIGAVYFDEQNILHLRMPFRRTLKIEDQLRRGRKIEEDTLKFWLSQSQESRDASFKFESHVTTAMLELRQFLADAEVVWAKPPQFDCVILEDLATMFGVQPLWDRRAPRDVRTLVNLANVPNLNDRINAGVITGYPRPMVAHDPVDDCIWQIQEVLLSRRFLLDSIPQ